MKIEISIDDGHFLDLRTLALLEKHNLTNKAIFYIAPLYMPIDAETIKKLAEKCEIGGHTLRHGDLTKMSLEDAKKDIEDGKRILEGYINKKITKFAYPKGHFNEDIKRLVKEAGFTSARTMKKYQYNMKNYDPYEQPVTIHFYPGRYQKLEEYFNKAKNDTFHLVFHSWEIAKFGLWKELDESLKYINENQNNTTN